MSSLMRSSSALILPHDVSAEDAKGMDDSDFWIGKIREIRAPNDSDVGLLSCQAAGLVYIVVMISIRSGQKFNGTTRRAMQHV